MQNKLNPKGVIFIFLLGIAVYSNSFRVNFIWDDIALILDNVLIKKFSHIFKIFTAFLSCHGDTFYRPLQNLTYMVDFSLYSFDYRGYHLTNIILHIAAVLLFYKIALILTKNDKLSFFSALLFLVSPLWVESVTYISGRADILVSIFIFLSFIAYLKERILISLIFYLGALLSKEAGLIYPLILVLYIALFKKFNRKTVYPLILFYVITIMYLWVRFMPQNNQALAYPAQSLYGRVLFFIKAIPLYWGLIFMPINQHMSYVVSLPHSFLEKEVILSFIFCFLLVYSFFYFLKKEKFISFFLGYFFILLIPYSGLFPTSAFFAEHFIYPAAAGVFIIFVYFLQKIKSKFISHTVLLGYLAFFSLVTFRYNFIWQDAKGFYERIIRLSPQSSMAYNNLGAIYLNEGNYGKAEEFLKKSIGINPGFQEARLNLARFYYLKGDYSRAIGLAKGVLDNDPQNYYAWDYLGTFYFKEGKPRLAEDCFLRALALQPRYLPPWLDLYSFYKSTGKEKKAGGIRAKIAGIDRNFLSEIYFREAGALGGENKLDAALANINEAIKINAYNSNYYSLRGAILRRKGDYIGAWHNFKQALKISPWNWGAYNSLGNLFAAGGNFSYAEQNFKKAISLNPTFYDAYFNLGLLYFQQKKFTQARECFTKALSLNASHALAKDYLNRLPK